MVTHARARYQLSRKEFTFVTFSFIGWNFTHLFDIIHVKRPLCKRFVLFYFGWIRSLLFITFTKLTNEPMSWLTHIPLNKMAVILADDIFKCIFLNENDKIPIWISLKLVPRSPIDDEPALVQVIAWRRTGDKPLPEPMLTQFTDAYMRHSGEVRSLWPAQKRKGRQGDCPGSHFRRWSLPSVSHVKSGTVALTTFPFQCSDTKWRHRFGSTLVQIIACRLTAPSH